MCRPSKCGFTLVELLVVIAIIAILAAILFPVFSTARAKARRTKCQSNMMQLVTALKVYKEDYRYFPPPPFFDGNMYQGGFSALYPEYVSDWDVMICPDDYDVKARQTAAKAAHYCSYNGRIMGQFDSTSANFWQLMPVGANGYSPDPSGNLADPARPRMRLYNFGGYNDYGYDVTIWNGGWIFRPNPAFGDTLAATAPWLRSWRQYARMSNNRAPDSTIAAHCVLHRGTGSITSQRDIVLLLGGRSSTRSVSDMQKLDATYNASEFRMQK